MLTKSKLFRFFNKNCKKILVLGVGGVSMSSLALLLQKNGCEVVGYDSAHGQFTKIVEEAGIHIAYTEEEVDTDGVEIAVYTSAIKEDSTLITGLRAKGIECIVRAEFLGELMKAYKSRIGVAGTHGKSTVSGMISSVFIEADRDPTVMIGAGLQGITGGFRAGANRDYVFEACEYRDSFLSFSPTVSVILNVELDHTDYFKSLEQMKESFIKFMNISADNGGVAVVNFDNKNARDCAEKCKGEVISFSTLDKGCDFFADNITYSKGKPAFDVYRKGEYLTHITLSVYGEFQVSNALAAIASAHFSGVDLDATVKALSEYTGVTRRFQLRGYYNGAEIRDDYAHHPDEIRATLNAVENAGYRKVYVVYQPHTYTRTHDLFEGFKHAFDKCDEVVFADIYAAREKNLFGISSRDLADAIPHGKYLGDFNAISEYYREKLCEEDLLIIMGAGDIINLEI